MFILASMITYCPVLDEGSDLWPLLRLAEEVLLLKQHFQFLMTKLLPQTINLYASISIYLSSNYSSGVAHSPIPISSPFIPTITPRNSTLLLLRKKKGGFRFSNNYPSHSYVISFCAGVFQMQRGTLLTLRHLGCFIIYFLRRLVPHVLRCDGDPTVENFTGIGQELSRLLFPSLYILLEDSSCSTFCIFNSQEPIRGALLYFHKLPLAFLLKFRTSSSLASLIYTSSP